MNMNITTKTLAGIALVTATACSTTNPVKFTPTFNAAYVGANTKQEEGYTRVFTGANIGDDSVRIHYHGLNEISGNDTSTYFGRNLAGVEVGGSGLEAVVDIKTDSEGIIPGQPYYGIRDLGHIKIFGADYGFLQVTTNGQDTNLTTFYGKNMGFASENLKPLDVQFFNTYQHNTNSKDNNYTEVTAQWNLTKTFDLFVRQDTSNWKFDQANYVIGGVFKL